MSAYIAELKRVVQDLNGAGVQWALVGAFALSIHAEARATKDIDVAVALGSDEELERLVSDLTKRGYRDPQLLMHTEPVFKLGYRVSIPSSKPYSIPLDILRSSCGIEAEIVRHAVTIEVLPSVAVPLACRGHLIAMKVLSQDDWERVRDKADIVALLSHATATDIQFARESLSLITERGFNRGRDLHAILELFLRQ